MPKAPQFCVSMPAPSVRKLNKLAKEDGRSRSQFVRRLIEREIAAQETKAA
jgi:metal-responsive CopG/Arc/MetJ family transcriptional regulator